MSGAGTVGDRGPRRRVRRGSLDPRGRVVVVTGASSGLGRDCALHLDRLGFRVFAGVRKDADGERLVAASTGALSPVNLDVTDEPGIARAAGTVEAALGGRRLWGLVNNAGIVVPSPLAWLETSRFREQLETGLVGQLAVIQAFLPLLDSPSGRDGGRIVNVTSGLGSLGVPFLGAYVAAQFGKEGLSDVLRREVAPLGVAVSVVRTGAIVTPMWEKAAGDAERAIATVPAGAVGDYRTAFRRFMAENERTARASRTTPGDFAGTVATALTARRPRTRYAVGRDAVAAALLARIAPARTLDRQFRGVVSASPDDQGGQQ